MAENLIRLKQLNQTEITGLVQNVIQSNSYTLMYNGGTGFNVSSIGGINLNNIIINISGSKVTFDDTTDVNLNDNFPPATGIRRYFPETFQSTFSTASASGYINYFPFIMKKTTSNAKACVELVTWTSDNTIRIGLYSGKYGIENAKLFWSGDIRTDQFNTGIYRKDIPYKLEKGNSYIIASMNYTGSSSSSFRALNTNHSRSVYGENTGVNIIGGVTASSTTVHLYDTGINLYSSIRTGFWTSSSTLLGPLVCLEY